MMDLLEAAQATGGTALHGNPVFVSVSTDSRKIGAGELFVALAGENFDGHAFVADVMDRGAAAAMVATAWAERHGANLPLLAVPDTRLGLGALAAAWRARFSIPLIGITGSNGKTTVKEMCAAILREQARREGYDGELTVLATVGNLNNDIGLPQMLLRLSIAHRAAVIEMGMNHAGEIAYLTRLARPTIALVNNAQRAHLAGLGGLTEVARAKGEIFEGLGVDGIAVINGDDPHCDLWRQLAAPRRIVSFALRNGDSADVGGHYQAGAFGGTLTLRSGGGQVDIELGVPGTHNAGNALAAAAAMLTAGVPLEAVAAGLAGYRGVKGRLQLKSGANGARVIDDSYNANPDSMRAAIDVLAAVPGRTVLVMGDMGETGDAAGQFHDEIGGYAKSQGIERLLTLGDLSAAAAHNFGSGGEHFQKLEDLLRVLRAELSPQTTVLVKGSRFMRMERVVEAIAEREDSAAGPPQGGISQQPERAQPANNRHPLPGGGGRGEGT
jgi:UDP-N-acetylmuramoyl-tripeptide--D-alanyl-D-alanine ligase